MKFWVIHGFITKRNLQYSIYIQEGVSVKAAKDSVGVSTKKAWTYDNKAMLYGQFVKVGIISVVTQSYHFCKCTL